MREKEIKNPGGAVSDDPIQVRRAKRYFNRRNAVIAAGLAAILLILVGLLSVVTYRYGVYDSYIKSQFVAKMADVGMVFSADVFQVTVNPLELELKNATFKDRVTGENLFTIREAHLNLTVQNLYAWQLSRDISIDKTQISGAEAWVKFDEDGRSNFANIKLIEQEPGARVRFKYQSVDFQLQDSMVHFGDLSRKLSGNAKNVLFLLSPENRDIPDEEKRYKFDLTSTDSNFAYDTSTIEKIDIRAAGIADRYGAEISQFDLRTPIGESTMSGTLTDWAAPKYNLDIQSTVDLTQASDIFAIGTRLVAVGNFKGKVTGEGETYRIEGEADAQSLRAGGVYLKAVNVAATVAGTNTNYEANGRAVAEMLTFEDFRVDFLRMVGNVRGTGTDFRWVGELEAAAAKSPLMSLGGLFLTDAVAEYKDKQFTGEAGSGRAQKFSVKDTEFAQLQARNVKFSVADGVVSVTAPNGQAKSLSSKDYNFQGVSGRNLEIKNSKGETQVKLENVM